jgi:hypothetical protein
MENSQGSKDSKNPKTDFNTVLDWYSRPEVQKAIVDAAKGREAVSVFTSGAFGKRPDILQYPADVVQAVRDGAVSFHASLERWSQPMKLESGMTKQQLDEIRTGWDILIDPDVPDFEIAKAAVKQVVETFKDHGVRSYSVKYTGGKGFHIGVPFEALPAKINMRPTETMYPEALGKIVQYIKWYSTEPLREALLAIANPLELAKRVDRGLQEITGDQGIEPFKIVSMDVFGSRHLFRLPFSLHEKSMRVSVPVDSNSIDKFEKDDALPGNVKSGDIDKIVKAGIGFLSARPRAADAEALVVEALDWAAKYGKPEKEALPKPARTVEMTRVPETHFPPCIQAIMKGVADGRKRSTFVLINFLRNMGWGATEIEKALNEWNERNYPPLRSNYVRSQLRWHLQQQRNLLPPNCDNANFYLSFHVCAPDGLCKLGGRPGDRPGENKITIKNPVNYPFRLIKQQQRKLDAGPKRARAAKRQKK